jgi:hypothetical protein
MKKIIAFIIAVASLATPLFATTVQKMELPELVSTSDHILQGHVASVDTRYQDGTIYTYITLAVDDPIKGDTRRSVVVRQLGGRIGAKMLWVPGMPQFKNTDQVVVFLRNRGDGTFDVIGLNQGKYDIVDNYAVAHVSGVTVVDPKTGVMSDGGFVEKAPLDAFKAKIRELMR